MYLIIMHIIMGESSFLDSYRNFTWWENGRGASGWGCRQEIDRMVVLSLRWETSEVSSTSLVLAR